MTKFRLLWRLRKNPWSRRLLVMCDPMLPLKLSDIKFLVSMRIFRHSGYSFGSSKVEPNMHRLFLRICKTIPKLCFLDVGANIGVYTWMAKSCKPESEIIAFEPDPGNFACMEATVKRNSLAGITLINKAVSDKNESAPMRVDRLSGQTGSIIARFPNSDQELYEIDAVESINVNCITLDDVMNGKCVQLLKVDVEGAEMRVLNGARSIIKNSRPFILVEFANWNLSFLMAFSKENGYTVFKINDPQIGPCVNLLLAAMPKEIIEECVSARLLERLA